MQPTVPGWRGDFHARVRRVEPGLYRAEYRGEFNPEQDAGNPPERQFPDFHLADSLEAAQQFVESLAKEMNYRRVVWDSLPT